MVLSKVLTFNYKSCKATYLDIKADKPNILIGMNDCGKTTFLQSLDLIFNLKSSINYSNNESMKSDLSHTYLRSEKINEELGKHSLPFLGLDKNSAYIVILVEFTLEYIVDNEVFSDDSLTNHFRWLLYSASYNASNEIQLANKIYLARVFNYSQRTDSIYYLTLEGVGELKSLHSLTKSKLNTLFKEYNKKINFDKSKILHFDKIERLYLSCNLKSCWTESTTWKKDIDFFPIFRYLDWNQSVGVLKNTAKDILTNSISHEYESAKKAANKYSEKAQQIVDKELEFLGIHEELDNIKNIHANVFFKVDYQLSDLLINKSDSEHEVHIDNQGEGIKRQLWFAFLKSQAEKDTRNSKRRFVWCFDEPETHLHPKAQRDFLNIIKSLTRTNFQVLISTHSTIFVDSSNATEIYNFNKVDNYTNIGKTTEVIDIYKSLGLRNSDFLFYDKFLIVEGNTEEVLIPKLYELYFGNSLRDDNIQLVVLEGHGNKSLAKDMLSKLISGFAKVSEMSIYILDSDVKFSKKYDSNDTIFLLGKQDIEDSISVDVWHSLSNDLFGDLVDVSKEEISKLIDQIPDDEAISENKKFAKIFRALIQKKLEHEGKPEEIRRLPQKGSEWGELIAKHITLKKHIPDNLCLAFDKSKK